MRLPIPIHPHITTVKALKNCWSDLHWRKFLIGSGNYIRRWCIIIYSVYAVVGTLLSHIIHVLPYNYSGNILNWSFFMIMAHKVLSYFRTVHLLLTRFGAFISCLFFVHNKPMTVVRYRPLHCILHRSCWIHWYLQNSAVIFSSRDRPNSAWRASKPNCPFSHQISKISTINTSSTTHGRNHMHS